MKKLLIISILLGSTVLMAESSDVIKKTMQDMEVSMAFIQKGFLYNHKGRIESGVTSLRRALKNIDHFVIEKDKNVKFDPQAYAKTETRAIDMLASKIIKGFEDGHKDQVLLNYQHMLDRCVTCHALVRRW